MNTKYTWIMLLALVACNSGTKTPKAVNDTITVNNLEVISGDASANDQLGEGTLSQHIFAVTQQPDSTKGTLNFDTNGKFNYTPIVKAENSFTYKITDTKGASSTAVVSIKINITGKSPQAVNDRITLNKLAVRSGTVSTNDQLGDGTLEQHTFAIVQQPDSSSGTLSFDANGSYVYTPITTAVNSFKYSITDSNGDSSTATVDITR